MTSNKIIIIGAGLTGLTLSFLLKKKGLSSTILEARDRVGGRIHTKHNEGMAPIEMGATWFGRNHIKLQALLKEVDIGTFQQDLGGKAIYEPISTSPPQLVQLPPNEDPSFRIQGGTSAVIKKLTEALDDNQLLTGQIVNSIEQEGQKFKIGTNSATFKADILISTLPPFLLSQSIKFEPNLPANLLDIAENTHTWMGESIKIGLTYEQPFWRKEDSSGTIFSNVGPIPEMYDHSNHEDSLYALKGFLNGAYSATTKEQRIETVLNQLEKYYGSHARNYLTYEEVIWRDEPFTFSEYKSDLLPHQNNGDSIFTNQPYSSNFFTAGSETSPTFPGYMEGAVHSALVTSESIAKLLVF